jgi:hypothetical protein
MDFDAYLAEYKDFMISLFQVECISGAAVATLSDFPGGLPPSMSELYGRAMDWLADPERDRKQSLVDILGTAGSFTEARVVSPAIMLVTFAVSRGAAPGDIDFPYVVHAQEHVMYFAHLDAFLAGTVRCICMRRPEVMKSSKKLTWEQVIEAGAWDALLQSLVERYVFEFGWPPVAERLAILQRDLGLSLTLPQEELEILRQGEELRNLIVHNGGRLSQAYVDARPEQGLVVGEYADITYLTNSALQRAIVDLVGEIVRAVAEAHFGMDRNNVQGIFPLRGEGEESTESNAA